MKTKEEAAREYCKCNQCPREYECNEKPKISCYYIDCFLTGIDFAEQWISVDDELPENQDIVLIKTDLNCVCTAYLHGQKSNFITYGEHAYNDFGKIIYWRPLRRK